MSILDMFKKKDYDSMTKKPLTPPLDDTPTQDFAHLPGQSQDKSPYQQTQDNPMHSSASPSGLDDKPDMFSSSNTSAQKLDSLSQLSHDYGPSRQPQQPSQATEGGSEVTSAKLDTIKAMLETINQRLSNIERKMYEDSKNKW